MMNKLIWHVGKKLTRTLLVQHGFFLFIFFYFILIAVNEFYNFLSSFFLFFSFVSSYLRIYIERKEKRKELKEIETKLLMDQINIKSLLSINDQLLQENRKLRNEIHSLKIALKIKHSEKK